VNFVRGEDSFVRAQWADKPFVWHIYPQDENLHHKKLRAFLQRYASGLENLIAMSLHWNGAAGDDRVGWPAVWQAFHADMEKMTSRAVEWERKMLENGDFASNLIAFIAAQRAGIVGNKV
jgi:uncharacterized repeat protein (TIGR03837 family)